MKVLVTGCTGFIGGYVVRKLLGLNAEIVGVDIRPSEFAKVSTDITDYQQLEQNTRPWQFDHVIHLAGKAVPNECDRNPIQAMTTNVYGTYNVLRLALKAGAKKVVFASSAHVYGISPKYMPTDERHPRWLQDVYTTTKIMGEELCRLFYDNHNLAYTTIRLFNGYGPGQSDDYFIPAMIQKARTGHILLKGPKITKDFVFVEDVADAFSRAALETDYVGELNIGTGVQTPLEVVARYIADKFSATLETAEPDNPGPSHMLCDASRARKILGWSPKTSLEEGLDRTIEFSSRKGDKSVA